MAGLFISADYTLLDDYVGPLSNAIVPVWDGTTGLPYKIAANNILIGGTPTMMKVTAVGGPVENIAALHGKVVMFVFRGLSLAGYTITTGTPTAQEVKWDGTTDDLTAPAGNDWLGGEVLYILYIN